MILTALALTAVVAQEPPVRDPRAVLNEMARVYRTFNSLTMDSIRTSPIPDLEEDTQLATPLQVRGMVKSYLKFRRPNSFALHQIDQNVSPPKTTRIVSNGKLLFTPVGERIVGREAPPSLDGSLRYFDRLLPDPGFHLIATLGTTRDVERFFKGLANLRLLPRQTVDGRLVELITADYRNSKGLDGAITFTIGADDHLLHKLVIEMRPLIEDQGAGTVPSTVRDLYEWTFKYVINPKLDETTFAAPEGAIIP